MLRKILRVSLSAAVLFLANPMVSPALAQDGAPTPDFVELQQTASLPWYVAVILFIAVAIALTVFKTRMAASRKKPIVSVNCCAPLIEEGTHPFRPSDDLPEQNS